MRLKLTLKCNNGALLALNNRYELSAVLYKIIEKSDNEFSKWLHDNGYLTDGYHGRKFKLFTYGWLNAYPFEMRKEQNAIAAKEGKVTWEISFCVEKIIEHFVAGLFQDVDFELKAGFLEKVAFEVRNVEVLKPPVFSEMMQYRCDTPILIGQRQEGSRNEKYLSPLDADFADLFLHNLRGKVKAVQGDAFVDSDAVSFRLLSPAEQVKRKPFEIYKDKEKLRYIPYTFDFELIAPASWQQIGFFAGFGQDNALGLGMGKVLR